MPFNLNLKTGARFTARTITARPAGLVTGDTARDWSGAINPAEEAAQRRADALAAMKRAGV